MTNFIKITIQSTGLIYLGSGFARQPRRVGSILCTLVSVHLELTEDKEKPTAVCAKKAHKGGFDAVNRVNSGCTLVSVHLELTEDKKKPTAVCAKKAHKGGFDAVNRVNSGWTLVKV